MKYMFFDLDGTLTDSAAGIIDSVIYALDKLGIKEDDRVKLRRFVGPPLMDSFREQFNFSEEDARRAVGYYREHYAEKGIFECPVYEGIPELLARIQQSGFILAVTTCKPEVFTTRILEHFDLAKYFSLVAGSTLDGSRSSKGEIIDYAIEKLGADNPKEIVIIGDRKMDIEAALERKIRSVGVMYGYGGLNELMEAGADDIVGSVPDLSMILGCMYLSE